MSFAEHMNTRQESLELAGMHCNGTENEVALSIAISKLVGLTDMLSKLVAELGPRLENHECLRHGQKPDKDCDKCKSFGVVH